MSMFKNIIPVLLAVAFFNVIVSKSVHEFFEHDHVEHTCDVKDLTHYHEFEFAHTDFICDFNISSTDSFDFNYSFQAQLAVFQTKVNIIYLWLVKNLFYDLNLQRGPPVNS